MFKKSLFFLSLCAIIACQQDDSLTPKTTLSSENALNQIESSSFQYDLDPSILNSDWWNSLHPFKQNLIALEISHEGSALTYSELEERFLEARMQSVIRANVCPGYPVNNPEGDVILETQADVDAFGALNCKEIIGVLDIVDTLGLICDLSPLQGIKEVGSSLTINADCLTNLNGLDKVKSVGALGPFGFVGVIGSNLVDIEALSKLTTVTGSINIIECDLLTSVQTAFANITTIESGKLSQPLTSLYVLNIDGNDALTDLSAFSGLTYIEGSLRILDNASLLDLDDFSGLNSIGDDIFVLDNPSLLNVNELSNISTLQDDLFVFNNISLTECCGLYNLLCNDAPSCSVSGVGDIILVDSNGAGCTDVDIIANGPCL